MKVTILGCGTSGGVPRVGAENGGWGDCDPCNTKNRRRRVSVLVEEQGTRILIDTSPDLREQLLSANVTSLDAVFLTHDHADHTHGIDDLRGIFHAMGKPIPIHMDARTHAVMAHRFNYVFHGTGAYPAIAEAHILQGDVQVGPLLVRPFQQHHGEINSIGYRVRDFAYSTDVIGFPSNSETYLQGLKLWVVDALRRTPHPTHPHLDLTLSWIRQHLPKLAVLTHMDWSMDYETLQAELPSGVTPGFDGMEINLDEGA
jgi:phosphoribosyl 1,2-cyclic phosphate phosphodiesterase